MLQSFNFYKKYVQAINKDDFIRQTYPNTCNIVRSAITYADLDDHLAGVRIMLCFNAREKEVIDMYKLGMGFLKDRDLKKYMLLIWQYVSSVIYAELAGYPIQEEFKVNYKEAAKLKNRMNKANLTITSLGGYKKGSSLHKAVLEYKKHNDYIITSRLGIFANRELLKDCLVNVTNTPQVNCFVAAKCDVSKDYRIWSTYLSYKAEAKYKKNSRYKLC